MQQRKSRIRQYRKYEETDLENEVRNEDARGVAMRNSLGRGRKGGENKMKKKENINFWKRERSDKIIV